MLEKLYNKIIFQFVGDHPAGMGFDSIAKVSILSSPGGVFFVFGYKYLFSMFQSFIVF